MASRPFDHGFEHDVFISYTHIDNAAVGPGGIRWVSQLHKDLEIRLAQLTGRSVKIWRDQTDLPRSAVLETHIRRKLEGAAVLAAVLSPSYFGSEPCGEERTQFCHFCERRSGIEIGTRMRIVKVAKTRVDYRGYPPPLDRSLEHRFYSDVDGKEFLDHPDETVRRLYNSVLHDLAEEIGDTLSELEKPAQAGPGKNPIFIAETSDDIAEERRQLIRELKSLGHNILPRQDYRFLSGQQLEDRIVQDLQTCQLSIHPVGGWYGYIPERQNRSIVELQIDLAIEDRRNGDFSRILWLAGSNAKGRPDEERLTRLIERIRKEHANRASIAVVEEPRFRLQEFVKDRLALGQAKPAEPAPKEAKQGLSVYLVCHPCDLNRSEVGAIFDHLDAQSVTCCLRDSSGTQEEFLAFHRERLLNDDGFLFFCGEASTNWVSVSAGELKKLRGAQRYCSAVYFAPPERKERERFRLLEHRIDGCTGFRPEQLDEFLRCLKGVANDACG